MMGTQKRKVNNIQDAPKIVNKFGKEYSSTLNSDKSTNFISFYRKSLNS